MARTKTKDVKEILDTVLNDGKINAFIATSNLIVTEELSSEGLTDARLKEIEKWLAAHLASTRDLRRKSETIDGGRVTLSYQGTTGQGLSSTFYGQQVIGLDPTGILVDLFDPTTKKASFNLILTNE